MSAVTNLVTLASAQGNPRDLAVDATHVYWTNFSSGTICRVPKRGGDVAVLAEGQGHPWRLAVDARFVFWVDEAAGGQITRAAKAGGDVSVLTTAQSPSDIKAQDGWVYWSAARGLYRMQASGGPVTHIAETATAPSRFALRDHTLFWSDVKGCVWALRIGDNAFRQLASGQGDPRTLAVDAEEVYWVTLGGAVRSTPIAGGEVREIFERREGLRGIAAGARFLYCTAPNGGAVLRIDKRSGRSEQVAQGLKYPLNVTTDGQAIFFTNYTGNSVMRFDSA